MIRIFGDTSTGLTVAEAKAHDIILLPQIVVFGEKTYRDDTEITGDEFVKMLDVSKELPKTAAPPPAFYNPYLDELREKGDCALMITPSAQLSGTYRSAMNAKQEYPDLDIRVVDSLCVGSGMAMMLFEARKMVEAGKSIDEIEQAMLNFSKQVRFFCVVDTLEYLYKGGRIGGASKLFGDVLQIKPILTLINGRVETFEKQRTKKKALARMVEIVNELCPQDGDRGFLSMSLQENVSKNEYHYLAGELAKSGFIDIPFLKVPPAFMVHAGPSVILVTFFAPTHE